MIRLMTLIITLALLPLGLTGCWDRTELNDMAFVLSSAVDKDGDGYRMSVMLPLPGQMGGAGGGGGGTAGGNKSYYIDSETGPTIRDATAKMQQRMSRRLFLSHRRTVLIGEEVAKEGISEIFDTIPRLPESRLSTFIVITKGPAYKLLNTKPKFERFPAEVIRELAKSPGAFKMNAKDVAATLSLGSDPIIIYMGEQDTKKAEDTSREIQILGYAQFKGDKMVGVYDPRSTHGLSWLRGKALPYSITLFDPKQNKPITLEVMEGTTQIQPKVNGKQVDFVLNMDAKAKVRENYSSLDMNETADIHWAERMLEDSIRQSVLDTVAQMQEKGTDSAHLGNVVWRQKPAVFRSNLESDWDQVLKQAKFTVNVKVGITDVGLINQNVTRRSY